MGLIYLDACLLIYLQEEHVEFGLPTKAVLAREHQGAFAISPMVKLECLVGPHKRGDVMLQQHYETVFLRFKLLDLPEAVYLLAAKLRGRFNLKTPDALHLACAQHHRCAALWTNDERLTAAGHGLARNALKSAQG